MHLVLDFGTQRHHGPLHDDDQEPGLQPDHQGRNEIQRQGQCESPGDRTEVHTLSGYHVHGRQQVGEIFVTTGPCCFDGLLFGQARRQLPADDTVEQQVGGMTEDAGPDYAEGDAADAERHHRHRQPTLGGEPFEQPDCRAREVARTKLCRFGQRRRSRQGCVHDGGAFMIGVRS